MKIQSAKAGIGTGRAGLQAASGLFSSAGLFQKGVKSFNPLDLDPYLLFDAETSMLGTLEAETLDLDPANPSSLDVITATRSGVATRTLPDGTIATAQPNTVRVDYTQGAELTPTKYQNVVQTDYSASPNGGFNMNLTDIDGPEGASGGVRVSETAVTGPHYLSVRNQEIVSGTTYTISFYIKEGSYSTVIFYTESLRIRSNVTIDFSNSSIQLGNVDVIAGSEILSNVGGGWYRVIYSATARSSGNMDLYAVVKNLNSYAGDINNFTDYYGFQVEEGTTASSFVENTTGSPKFITGATFGPRVPMILIEPSATNLVEYSEDFDGSYWSANNLTITPNADLLGTANVSLLQESTYTSALPKIQLASGFGNTSGEHTLSFYVKNNNNTRYLGFSFGSSSERIRDTFDLQTETFKGNLVSGTTTGSVSFDRLGDYYRINVTATFPSPVTVQAAIAPLSTNTYLFYSLQDSGNRSFYLWGAQLETGSVATSYIPTSGGDAAARTRAADDLVISGSAFSDFYNASEGTFYVESVPNENTSGSFLFDLSFGNASTERLAIYNSGSNQKIFLKSSGTTWSDNIIGNRPAGGVLSRAAISFKTNNIEASIDGANMTPDTSATMSTTINKMTIGNRYENPNYLNGRIRRLIFWPTHSDSL